MATVALYWSELRSHIRRFTMPIFLIMLVIDVLLLGISGLLWVDGSEDVATILTILGVLLALVNIYIMLVHTEVLYDAVMSLETL